MTIPLPSTIYAEATIKSRSGKSIFDRNLKITSENLRELYPDPNDRSRAAQALEKAGLAIGVSGTFSVGVAATPKAIEEIFGVELIAEHEDTTSNGEPRVVVTCKGSKFGYIETVGNTTLIDGPNKILSVLLIGVVISQPPILGAPAINKDPIAPYQEWYRTVKNFPFLLETDQVHDAGIKGRFVVHEDAQGPPPRVPVNVVDTGVYQHPYFEGSDISMSDGSSLADDKGHGTTMVGNILSMAPECRVVMYRTSEEDSFEKLKSATGDIPASRTGVAARLGATRIISCSWGYQLGDGEELTDEDKLYIAEIKQAYSTGNILLFGSGNFKPDYIADGGPQKFPAQMAEVIAVGGAYYSKGLTLLASDSAAGFQSKYFTDPHTAEKRIVPDVCGLCGPVKLPGELDCTTCGDYLMLPTAPDSPLDYLREDASCRVMENYPESYSQRVRDGWCCTSGTSSATAQVAGLCALIVSVYPSATVEVVRHCLRVSAKNVSKGKSANDNPASDKKPNLATGYGLVQGMGAVQEARRLADQANTSSANLVLSSASTSNVGP